MGIFTNKQDFANNVEVFNLLTALEKAHEKNDEFSAAVLLTKLNSLGVTISEESACNLN